MLEGIHAHTDYRFAEWPALNSEGSCRGQFCAPDIDKSLIDDINLSSETHIHNLRAEIAAL